MQVAPCSSCLVLALIYPNSKISPDLTKGSYGLPFLGRLLKAKGIFAYLDAAEHFSCSEHFDFAVYGDVELPLAM